VARRLFAFGERGENDVNEEKISNGLLAVVPEEIKTREKIKRSMASHNNYKITHAAR
jgi:hypothetical protein